jgi:hypothetical protein
VREYRTGPNAEIYNFEVVLVPNGQGQVVNSRNFTVMLVEESPIIY